jgi:chromosome segregation ATPase
MNNQINTAQAIEQLKREIQRETTDLVVKENTLKTSEADKLKYTEVINKNGVEVKKKEAEILVLVKSIQDAKSKIPEIDRNIRKLTEEIAKIKREQVQKNQEMRKIQNEYDAALRNSKNITKK